MIRSAARPTMPLQPEPRAGTTVSAALPTSMRALVKEAPEPGLALRTVPVPPVGPGEVLVRVAAGGICGTDLHIYTWDAWAAGRLRPPVIVGHEFCGTVVATGEGVTSPAVGDFIAGESHLACGACRECRGGREHICERLQVLGVDRDGAFAEYVVLPARNAWRLDPQRVPVEVAAVMDPLGNAVHSALAADPVGRAVAVIGCGPIGLMAIAVLRLAGAALVAASDVRPERRALARQLGADLVLDPAADDVPARLRAATGGHGVDIVLEMSGHPAGLRDGLHALRPGGFVALLGLPAGPVEVDLARDVIAKAARLHGIYGRRIWETWEQATALLARGLEIRPVVTHRLPLARFAEAFALLAEGRAGKVILTVEG